METSVSQISLYIVSWYYFASFSKKKKKKKKFVELALAINLKVWY